MNNVHEFPQTRRRFDEAGVWVAKIDNELTAAETREFQKWMAADPQNQEVLFEMAKLWDKISVMSRLSDLFPESPSRHQKRSWYPLAVAASVVLLAVIGLYAMGDRSMLEPFVADGPVATVVTLDPNVYETAVGEQSTVSLPDGSEIVLNTNSLVRVDYTEEYRLIHLERGEIHVVVVPDKSRPLSVISNNRIVQAVGTAFGLYSTAEGQLELIVVEGKVIAGLIDPHAVDPDVVLTTGVVKKTLAVSGGQEVMLGSVTEEVRSVSVEEMEVRLSWHEGNLIFRDESLEEALAEISRYSSVRFEILDDEIRNIKIAGRFRVGDVDGLIAVLAVNLNVKAERTQDGRVLLSRL